jgi:GT2 family glycosyltransferase
MTRRPPVTLLLPNRNNEPVLDLTLERLAEHTSYPDFELIVVDDGSTDASVDVLRRWRESGRFRDCTLIEREHGGVVKALNAGLEAASGELVVQLDGDATLETPGWLERMVDFHQSDPRIGVVNPLVTFETSYIHAAGLTLLTEEGLHDRGSWPTEPAGARTLHSVVERHTPESAGTLASEVAEVDACIGVCMLYPRALAHELGGYDEGFSPVWFDDIDLSLRIRQSGLKTFYLPGVHVIHRIGMRNEREGNSGLLRARKAVAAVTPERVRALVSKIENRGTPHQPHQLRRLEHHYEYWREKWGFDLVNPDMDAIRARYADTELWWRYDPDRRAAGEEIAAAWSAVSSP